MFYLGMCLTAVGFLLFISTFISGALNFGDFSDFETRVRSMAIRAVAGMILMIVGGTMATIGRAGTAGSGLLLNPRKARQDLEPWSRSAGGMINDTLEEVDALKPDPTSAAPQTAVKIRCPHCRALNDEDAQYCKQCGRAL